MAYLINRNPSGRLVCLHGLLQYVAFHWGDGPYSIKNFKFDSTKQPDIHYFSPCASVEYGFPSCRYLDNPSSLAGCGLVNSLVEDTQKSKSASDIFNALDGLGLITRTGNVALITELGREFIATSRETPRWEEIARRCVQNYGPFAGLLELTSQFSTDSPWFRNQITLGFSNTGEEVDFQGERVILSIGSQNDTITRSRSSLINWGVATGFFMPQRESGDETKGPQPSQVRFFDYSMSSKLEDGFFNSELVYEDKTYVVERPLSYNQLVKSIRSLRENGQESQRQASLYWETVIKNRRLAIAYALHFSALFRQPLDFAKFVDVISKMPDFVVTQSDLMQTMVSELGNAFVIGTPFRVIEQTLLQGQRIVNLDVLSAGADRAITDQLYRITEAGLLFGGKV